MKTGAMLAARSTGHQDGRLVLMHKCARFCWSAERSTASPNGRPLCQPESYTGSQKEQNGRSLEERSTTRSVGKARSTVGSARSIALSTRDLYMVSVAAERVLAQ